MLFTNYIILISDTKQLLNARLDLWRRSLESNGVKIIRTKTEYMACNFGRLGNSEDKPIKI